MATKEYKRFTFESHDFFFRVHDHRVGGNRTTNDIFIGKQVDNNYLVLGINYFTNTNKSVRLHG